MLRLLLILPHVGLAVGSRNPGVTFYQVQGNRCLTTGPVLQTYQQIGSLSACMVQCNRNARCATMQWYPSNKTCTIFRSINYDYYWGNSQASPPGTCSIYNRKCVGYNWYFNFTGIYWLNNYNQGMSYYDSARMYCLNIRTDLLAVNTAAKLSYLSNTGVNGGIWFTGGYRNPSNSQYQWPDGTPVSLTMNSPISGCGSVNCLVYRDSLGLYQEGCYCNFAVLCGCEEWGMI